MVQNKSQTATNELESSEMTCDESFLSKFPRIKPHAGLFFSAVSICFYSGIATLVKFVNIHDPRIGANQILLFRSVLQLTVYIPPSLYQNIPIFYVENFMKILIFRGLCGWLVALFIYSAYQMIPLAEATAIQSTSPIFVFVLGYFFLQERVTIMKLFSPILVIVGTILIVKPKMIFGDFEMSEEYRRNLNWGIALCFGSSFFVAIAIVILKKLKDAPTTTVVNWYSMFCGIASLALILIIEPESFVYEIDIITLCLLFGVSCSGLMSQTFFKLSLKYSPASLMAVSRSVNIVLCIIIDHFAFNTHIDFITMPGIALIIIAVSLLAIEEYYSKPIDGKKSEKSSSHSTEQNIDDKSHSTK